MKNLILVWLMFATTILVPGQSNPSKDDEIVQQRKTKKLLLVSDLEPQIKAIPFAAIRVSTRYKLAAWLWKDGVDESGRAEDIAIAAIEDHYKNKNEIPFDYQYVPRLLNLLDTHAKDSAAKLREKYSIASGDESRFPSQLAEKGGEKLAVDSAVRLLSQNSAQTPDLAYLLMILDQRRSPELYRLLTSILNAEETGRIHFPTSMIEIFTNFFIRPETPLEMRKKFLLVVLARSRNVATLSPPDQEAYYRTLQRMMPDISANYPEALADAGSVYALLSSRASRSIREANERNERIINSNDKLAATVLEAEKAEQDVEKYSLYRSAARIALSEKKFVYAVDLMVKASEIDISASGTKKDFSQNLHDEFYRDVATKALGSDEVDAANYAIKRIKSQFLKAETIARSSKYYLDNGNLNDGRRAYDEVVALINKTGSSSESITTLIRMLPTVQKLDSVRILELSKLIAKLINAIPALDVEDKPETKKYLLYVGTMLTISSELGSALSELVKTNRESAVDIANYIEKKEIKIIAEYVLSTDLIDKSVKSSKLASSAEKHLRSPFNLQIPRMIDSHKPQPGIVDLSNYRLAHIAKKQMRLQV